MAGQFTCPHCGDTDDFDGDALADVVCCDKCKGVTAYGVMQPRVTIDGCPDRRFLIVRLNAIAVPLYRPFARVIAEEILSVCPPPQLPAAQPPLADEEAPAVVQ